MSFLKPKRATSTSENVNNGLITSTYGGQMGQGVGATNFLAQLLGVSPMGVANGANAVGNAANAIAGAGGAEAGYNNYLQRAGYAPAMRQLSQRITGQGAASGLLNSGSTARALQREGTELNQSFYNNYLGQLSNLAGLGLQAGGLVANTGQRSTSQGGGPSTAGTIASTLGGIASIFSDERLKEDIKKVGETEAGLPIYTFRYKGEDKVQMGVMAQDVEKKQKKAMGPRIAGYRTVNYAEVR